MSLLVQLLLSQSPSTIEKKRDLTDKLDKFRVLEYKIKYVPVPLQQVYQANEDMARMYEWYEKVGTGIDITSLHQEYPEVNWLTFKDWAASKLR